MNPRFEITRDFGHPWDKRTGWDLLEVQADSEDQLTKFIQKAVKKYWHEWIRDNTGAMRAVLYKPSGATTEWTDDPS